MAKIIERIAAPRNEPTSDIDECLKAEWGYILFFEDGSCDFEKARVPKKEKLHALKNYFLIDERKEDEETLPGGSAADQQPG